MVSKSEDFATSEYLKNQLKDILDSLQDGKKSTCFKIWTYRWCHRTAEEVGREFGVTRRIRQIEAKALKETKGEIIREKVRRLYSKLILTLL